MKIIPQKNYICNSKLAPEQVIEKIKTNTEEMKDFRFIPPFNTKLGFESKIEASRFKLKKIASRRSVKPIITGTVEKTNEGSQLFVEIAHDKRLYYMYSFFTVLTVGFILLSTFTDILGFLGSDLIPVILGFSAFFMVFQFLLLWIIFNIEDKRAKLFLEKILESELVVQKK